MNVPKAWRTNDRFFLRIWRDYETGFEIMTCNSLSESTFTSIYVTLSVFWCVLMSFDDVLYIPTGLSYQLSSASTHSLPSRIDQLSDSENDFDIEEDDSSSALGNSSFCIEFFSAKICPKYVWGVGFVFVGIWGALPKTVAENFWYWLRPKSYFS